MTTRKLIVIGSLVLVLLLAVALSFSVSPRADQSQDNQNTYGRPTDSFYDYVVGYQDKPGGMPAPEKYHGSEIYPEWTGDQEAYDMMYNNYLTDWYANEQRYLQDLEAWYQTTIVDDATGKGVSTLDYLYKKFNDTWANYHQEFYDKWGYTDDLAAIAPPATTSFDSFMVSCYSDSHNRPVRTPPANTSPTANFNRFVSPTQDNDLILAGIDAKDDGATLDRYAGYYNSCVDTWNKRNPNRKADKITKDQLRKAREDYKKSDEYQRILNERKNNENGNGCAFNLTPSFVETAHAQSLSCEAPSPGIDGNPDVSDTPEPQATE